MSVTGQTAIHGAFDLSVLLQISIDSLLKQTIERTWYIT